MKLSLRSTLAAAVVFAAPLLIPSAQGAEAPNGFSLEETSHGVTVKYQGALAADYVIDQANKPYLWPVMGPTGKPMTRAYPMDNVEGEVKDHPHHRSIWFGHENIDGFDIWTDKGTWTSTKKPAETEAHLARLGTIKHRSFKTLEVTPGKALIVAEDDILAPDGNKAFEAEERITFSLDGESRIIDYDIDILASGAPVKFGDAKDAGFNIRMPTSMSVDTKKGGQIVTSEGLTDAAAWGKRARWVDYHGPVDGELLGVAMLDHPSSFRHPTFWHVRTYGLFTANPFGQRSFDKALEDGAYTLPSGEHLKLRHRIIFHKGDEKTAGIEAAFAKYAQEPR